MTPTSTRHGSLWTRADWVLGLGLVLILLTLLTLGTFLGSMAAFYAQGWCLLRGLP